MIQSITIQNFKSIADVTLPLRRINVLIGENGCGKSNLLEGIALGAAAAQGKLDNEFLAPRGVRVAPSNMTSAFFKPAAAEIRINVMTHTGPGPVGWIITSEAYDWSLETSIQVSGMDKMYQRVSVSEPPIDEGDRIAWEQGFLAFVRSVRLATASRYSGILRGFLVYSPENSALRAFEREGQILPIGINGEGLFSHLRTLWDEDKALVLKISRHLELIDWFEGFAIPDDLGPGEHRLSIRDRFLAEGGILDQRSANEGFLFLLFYYTLFISPHTPSFFAIDNIDASLNPKLCQRLMRDLTKLATEHDKQVIFTTHNPAILDGLDLKDDGQRLLVVSRQYEGPTKVHRVEAPKPLPGDSPVRLSEAFMNGYLGGLPKNF